MVDAPFLIAVHVGAGYHSQKLEHNYKEEMASAARLGGQVLQEQGDVLKAITAAISVLEGASIGNAGLGSNLTMKGAVECDASVMSGDGAFGAVGAVSGIQNPVAAAARLAANSRHPLPLDRVRPMFLAGVGARQWALEQGLPAASSQETGQQMHITPSARKAWARFKGMMVEAAADAEPRTRPKHVPDCPKASKQSEDERRAESCARPSKRQRGLDVHVTPSASSGGPPLAGLAADDTDDADLHFDTVGAVCVDAQGRVAAGVSSGGIAMKTDGRVGEAAMYGCGCWAADPQPGATRPGAAASVTGVGEVIMRAGLGRAACAALQGASGAAHNDIAEPPTAGEQAACAAVTDVCARAIRELILAGQPPALPCPHADCGLLAVRCNVQERAGILSEWGGSPGAGRGGRVAVNAEEVARAGQDMAAGMASSCRQEVPGSHGLGRAMEAAEGCSGHEAMRGASSTGRGAQLAEEGSTAGSSGAVEVVVQVELGVTHNSGSMGFGYWAHDMAAPRCSILRQHSMAAQSGSGRARTQMCCEGVKRSWSWVVAAG